MKNYKVSLVGALALGSLLVGITVGSAQGTNQTNNGPVSVDARRAEHMAKQFNLSTEQQAKVQALFEDETRNIRVLQSDRSVPSQEKREKIRSMHQENDKKLKAIFTPEQWDKMVKEREANDAFFRQKKAEMDKKTEKKAHSED